MDAVFERDVADVLSRIASSHFRMIGRSDGIQGVLGPFVFTFVDLRHVLILRPVGLSDSDIQLRLT